MNQQFVLMPKKHIKIFSLKPGEGDKCTADKLVFKITIVAPQLRGATSEKVMLVLAKT